MRASPGSESFASSAIVFGADYNPEQWPRQTWSEDVLLMQQAGVTMVAVNIFGWARLEPRPGEYRFDDLDAVLDLLHEHGIAVNLGTGTATPPPWLTTRHPEVLPVTADGARLSHGGRQAWCPSSPVYREHALRLVDQVARRYADHPAVQLWHVSNELGCHNALCYCDVSAERFREWLGERYGTLDELNRVWGTSFWSQGYGAWEEILPPRNTPATANPGQQLDFRRFSSDELLDQYRAERDLIRTVSDTPVTTNFMVTAHIQTQDYWRWAPEMDLIANDHYLDHRLPDPHAEQAFAADLTRGLAGGRPWFLMESATSAVNWQPHNVAKRSGELLRDSLAAVARGADAVSFFQWRASVFGSEKFHSAMLPHSGTQSPQWAEVCELGRVLGDLGDVVGTTVDAQVALLFDWEAWWACDLDSRPSSDVRYLDEVHAMHRAFRAAGVTVDVVGPDTDLDGYRVVVVPTLYACSDATAGRVSAFVEGGGHAVVTYFSGIADENDHVRAGGYPGAFRDLLGVAVDTFHPLGTDSVLTLDDGRTASRWVEDMRLTGAEVLVRAVDGPVPGAPVLTRHDRGAGAAWYVATALDDDGRRALVARLADEAELDPVPPGVGDGIELVRRTGADGRSYAFVLNGTDGVARVALRGREVVTGEAVDGVVEVPAWGARVVREAGGAS